ncbi:MAG: hypothetical protein VYC82_05960 [Verrucomicrobiota bacterium]|nr:hypothetical protein [Verrucomicrobiota bacterium]
MAKPKKSSRRGDSGNVIAALASFFVPGLGQVVQGQLIWAAFFFLTSAALYFSSPLLLITLPFALTAHLWSVINAATFNPG